MILRICCCCWDSKYWPSLCKERLCLLLGVPFNKVLLISWAYFWPERVLLHFLVFCCSLFSHWCGSWCKLMPCRVCINVGKGLFLKTLHFSFPLLPLLETLHGIVVAVILLEPFWSSLANWRCNCKTCTVCYFAYNCFCVQLACTSREDTELLSLIPVPLFEVCSHGLRSMLI